MILQLQPVNYILHSEIQHTEKIRIKISFLTLWIWFRWQTFDVKCKNPTLLKPSSIFVSFFVNSFFSGHSQRTDNSGSPEIWDIGEGKGILDKRQIHLKITKTYCLLIKTYTLSHRPMQNKQIFFFKSRIIIQSNLMSLYDFSVFCYLSNWCGDICPTCTSNHHFDLFAVFVQDDCT